MGDNAYVRLVRENKTYRQFWLAAFISMFGEWLVAVVVSAETQFVVVPGLIYRPLIAVIKWHIIGRLFC